jgi:hypothetical protein
VASAGTSPLSGSNSELVESSLEVIYREELVIELSFIL